MDVKETDDGMWDDGYGFGWATRALAEQAHEQKKNFTAVDAVRKGSHERAYDAAEAQAVKDVKAEQEFEAARDAGMTVQEWVDLQGARRLAEHDKRVADAARKADQETADAINAWRDEGHNREALAASREVEPKTRRVDNAEVRWYDGYGGQWPTEEAANEAGEARRKLEKARAEESQKVARKKREADLVQDAIEMHDKIGRILHPLSGKSQKFHEAYSALALALLDLLEETR